MANPIEFDLQQVESLAERGLTQQQIADALGVSEKTVRNRIKDDADFTAAVKRGQAKGVAFVANALMGQVKGGNVTAMIFWLKCKGGFKEASDVNVNHTGLPATVDDFVLSKKDE